jgi:poly(A) polymerase
MIKTLINRLLGKSGATRSSKSPYGQRQDVGPQDHGIDPGLVDQRAADVVHTLKAAGFEAWYLWQITDQIGVQPAFFWLQNQYGYPDTVGALVRTTFKF